MPTPLVDALRAYAAREPVRFHMPGHKGRSLPLAELKWLAPIDVTELTGTGNLYEPGEPFDAAQALWAEQFGFEQCQFLTGGSTQGVYTGLALCCQPEEVADARFLPFDTAGERLTHLSDRETLEAADAFLAMG